MDRLTQHNSYHPHPSLAIYRVCRTHMRHAHSHGLAPSASAGPPPPLLMMICAPAAAVARAAVRPGVDRVSSYRA